MERSSDSRLSNGTGKTFYVHVSPENAKNLIQEAQNFVRVPDPELISKTEVLINHYQTVKDGMVRETTVTQDLTHKTVTIEFKIIPEAELLFHPKA